jgi:hypothetical protein
VLRAVSGGTLLEAITKQVGLWVLALISNRGIRDSPSAE